MKKHSLRDYRKKRKEKKEHTYVYQEEYKHIKIKVNK